MTENRYGFDKSVFPLNAGIMTEDVGTTIFTRMRENDASCKGGILNCISFYQVIRYWSIYF